MIGSVHPGNGGVKVTGAEEWSGRRHIPRPDRGMCGEVPKPYGPDGLTARRTARPVPRGGVRVTGYQPRGVLDPEHRHARNPLRPGERRETVR
ncbi:hypothetical protein CUT44_05120 [Streptomyces carminius]|uniref:Uncharacterized protein n=1 Tax=Streptomyces carminius TaxID=2665496 RepID=A0A2M8M553_9ACTN|nr:hypothetical protein CUT44_05120 [Streptomyces carminius]